MVTLIEQPVAYVCAGGHWHIDVRILQSRVAARGAEDGS